MKHDLVGRVLQILRIGKRPDSLDESIKVVPKLEYTEDVSDAEPYQGLEIPHWAFIEAYIANQGGGGSDDGKSLIETNNSVSIDWQTDIATDEDGNPSDLTYEQKFGNTPIIQVWLEVSTNNYSLEVVPVTMILNNGDISNVSIDTSGLSARIIIN